MIMRKSILTLSVLTLLIASCKKEEPQDLPTPWTSEMSSFFEDANQNAIQTFNFNAAFSQELNGSNGTRIHVPANAFVNSADGSSITGNVNLELTEVLDVSEMVRLNKPTTSNDQVLVSGGQLEINVFQNENKLKLASGKSLTVDVPTSSFDPNMELFTGTENSDGTVGWNSADNDPQQNNSVTSTQDSIGIYTTFVYEKTDLGWINLDYFINVPVTDIKATLSGTASVYTYPNTFCFAVFPDYNSIAAMGFIEDNVCRFQNAILDGNLVIVALSELNGDLYSGHVSTTVSENMNAPISMSQTTEAEIHLLIDSL